MPVSKLKNSSLTISADSYGAELCSIRGSSGTEYIWQADPSIWNRHAPVLFPIVGSLKNETYSFDGTSYRMQQHGFARNVNFNLIEKTGSLLIYKLSQSSETLAIYPWDFDLTVTFQLENNKLSIKYIVTNTGDRVMPFSIGAHPGLAFSWSANDKIEDYYLEFEKAETVDTHLLDNNHLLSGKKRRILNGGKTLAIKKDSFARDALIFMDLKSRSVSLHSRSHSNCVTVEYPDFPFLGIWAKPSAPYVCIEPWHGYVDPASHDGTIINKPGIIMLESGTERTFEHSITVLEK